MDVVYFQSTFFSSADAGAAAIAAAVAGVRVWLFYIRTMSTFVRLLIIIIIMLIFRRNGYLFSHLNYFVVFDAHMVSCTLLATKPWHIRLTNNGTHRTVRCCYWHASHRIHTYRLNLSQWHLRRRFCAWIMGQRQFFISHFDSCMNICNVVFGHRSAACDVCEPKKKRRIKYFQRHRDRSEVTECCVFWHQRVTSHSNKES